MSEQDYKRLSPITAEALRKIRRADPSLTVPSSLSMAEAAVGVIIERVDEDSPAAIAGIGVGEKLLRINGEEIRDTVDFYFHGSDARLRIDLEGADGTPRTIKIQKRTPEEHLGLELRQFTTQNCGCNCVFCFVHQLPDSMRKSLYVKDEDYRLSFMQGSYITGITLKDSDLERIARQRLTPLYISAHAVDEELRRWLLGVKKCPAILDVLNYFKKHRIQVHTQIVLCPTHNDGAQLDRTLDALFALRGTVLSVAIVPLGMTKWRNGLPDLPPVTPKYADHFIKQLTPRLRQWEKELGEPFVLLADEWYLIAGRKAPSYSKYPDLPQLENGVGMVYHFYKDLADAKKLVVNNPIGKKFRVAAITSTLSHVVLEKIIDACGANGEIEVTPLPTVNTVFGDTIHVTGLLCGSDLEKAIRDNPGYDLYLLPGSCLRKYDKRFLDDLTLEELRARTGVPIEPVLGGAYDFAATIMDAATGHAHATVGDHVFLAKHWSNT